jgi:hypothetical protein
MTSPQEARALRPLPSLIFASHWLQLPALAIAAAGRIMPSASAKNGEHA